MLLQMHSQMHAISKSLGRDFPVSCGKPEVSRKRMWIERNIFLECGFVSLFDVFVDLEECLSTRKHNHVPSLYKNSKALAGNVLPEHGTPSNFPGFLVLGLITVRKVGQ